MPRRREAFDCPHCGTPVPAGALSCRGCGSDAQSGWSEEAEAWAGDLPVGYGEDEEEEGEVPGRATTTAAADARRKTVTFVLVIGVLLVLAVLKRVLRVH